MGRIRPPVRRPSAPMVIALLALFVALGGPAHAAKLISGARIKPNTIASKQVKDGSLKLRDLGPGAARALRATPNGSLTAPMFREDSVTARAIAPGSVLTGHVADNSLTAADLGTNSVGPEEIADNAVGQLQIRENGVAGSEIADGGLSIRDVARQVGSLTWPVPTLRANACDVKRVPITGFTLRGDFVVLQPTTPWPSHLVYAVTGTPSATEFQVQACALRDVAGATYRFNYAILGF